MDQLKKKDVEQQHRVRASRVSGAADALGGARKLLIVCAILDY